MTDVEEGAMKDTDNRGNFHSVLLKKIKLIEFAKMNQGRVSKISTFDINPRLVNKYEKEKNIEFNFEFLKNYMDKWIEEGVTNNEGNWEKRKEAELVKVWNRWEGSEFSMGNPVLRAEHYFPDINDKEVLLQALLHERMEWDKTLEKCDELTDFTNEHTIVHHCVNKGVLGTQGREFIDKKIYFRTSDIDPQLKGKDQDEIYLWVTSAQDDIVPNNPSKNTRAQSIIGMWRIGKRPNGCGLYLHVICQTDLRLSTWTTNLLYPIAPQQLTDWGIKFRDHCNSKVSGN